MPDKEDEIASIVRDLESQKAALASLDALLDASVKRESAIVELRRKALEDGIAGNEAALKALGHGAKPPAKRAETRPATESEKRGPGRPKKAE